MGWAITVAGEQGAELERECGAWLAGALIYQAAYPAERIPDFLNQSTEEARRDIEACAEGERLSRAP